MYGRLPSFVFGFHGCDESVCKAIINGEIDNLIHSTNDYDWLGHGIYFWENDPKRALEYAEALKQKPRRSQRKILTPSVLGAAIDLGYCLNLMESSSLSLLKTSYDFLHDTYAASHQKMPHNLLGKNTTDDLLVRNLDCQVIESLHLIMKDNGKREYDTVRGLFFEGDELYPNAGFKEKNHIQICVRNSNCIKAYFLPREPNELYPAT